MAGRRFPLCGLKMMMVLMMVVSVERLGSRSRRRGGRMGMGVGSRRVRARVHEVWVVLVMGGLRGGLFEQRSRIGWKMSDVN